MWRGSSQRSGRGKRWGDLVDWPKLREMMMLACELNKRLMDAADTLCPRLARQLRVQGGNTLLGSCYAKSDRMFFGGNPGSIQEDSSMDNFAAEGWPTFQYGPVGWPYRNKKTGRIEPAESRCAGSWDDDPQLTKTGGMLDYKYAKTCRWFFDDGRDGKLHAWIQEGTTHALIYPWRTAGEKELGYINKQLNGKLDEYSGQLLRTVLSHHRSVLRWIIVSGKGAAEDFQALSGIHWTPDGEPGYEGVHHQWSKWRSDDGLTLLQIPHFAWANKLGWLAECRDWLKREIGLTS